MPRNNIVSPEDRALGSLTNMHPELNGDLILLRDDLMAGNGDFNKSFGPDGSPEGFTLGQPARAVSRNLYGGTRAGQTTKQNDAPIDIRDTSDLFNRPFVDGEPLPSSASGASSATRSELAKPPAPILKVVPALSAGYPASTATSPYWITYSWTVINGSSVSHTPVAPATRVPALSQGQSIEVEIPEEAKAKYISLWITEPGTSTVTTPGTFRKQETFEVAQYPGRIVTLRGPFVHSADVAIPAGSSKNDTITPPPGSGQWWFVAMGSIGYYRALQNGAFFVQTYVTEAGETLPSHQVPDPPGINHTSFLEIDDIPVTSASMNRLWRSSVGNLPGVIGWHVYLHLNGQWYRHYDPNTGYGKTRPLPMHWHSILSGAYLGTESFMSRTFIEGFKYADTPGFFKNHATLIYPQEPPEVDGSGVEVPDASLPTPVVFGAARPGAGHYVFQTTEIDEDGKESEPSDVAEIDISDYDVMRIVFANSANRLPNATLVERGADGLPLDFTFVTTNGSVSLESGELIFKTTGPQTGTTPSGTTDAIDIDRTKDWSAGGLIEIENPDTGGLAGTFEAVLREISSSGSTTDTVLKSASGVGQHAFYQVISATGGSAPAWGASTTRAQLLYRFAGATKNATARISRQVLKDYRYHFRRREEPIPGENEPSNPNPPPATTAVPSGSTAVEPSPVPETVPETLTQTGPDRPLLSGATLDTGDLESGMPAGFTQVTSGSATLSRQTTPAITPLVGSYSLRSQKASGGLATAYLSKMYGSRETTLSGAMNSSQTTVPLTSLTYLPTSGTVYIGTEKITYTGKSAVNGAGNLTGCTRGAYSTTGATHSSGDSVLLLGRDSLAVGAKRQLSTLPNGRVTLGELRRWTDGARFAWVDLDNSHETAQLIVNTPPESSGNITTTLDAVGTNIAVDATKEQSRLTVTSGVTVSGGTPYTANAMLGLGGISYNIPVYGGGQAQIYDQTVLTAPGVTGYFYAYLWDSGNTPQQFTISVLSSDTTAQVAAKIVAAVNAEGARRQAYEWWTASYVGGSVFRITANTNGRRTGLWAGSASAPQPTFSYSDVQVGANSPRPQTERLQILDNFVAGSAGTTISISLGIPRSQRRGFTFTSLRNGDSPIIAAKKIYEEFQAKHTGYEWNASYVPGSDTVVFIQKQPSLVLSPTIFAPGLSYSLTTDYTGGENDTITTVAARVRNSNFSGWTTGNSGDVVDFFAITPGDKTDITFTGVGGVAATPTTIVQGSQDTTAQVAGKVVTAYSGNPDWTVTNASNVVTFVATASGLKTDATFSAGSTGVDATMTTPIQGSTDIVVNVYDPATSLVRKRRVQTSVTTSSVLNTEMSVQGAGKSDGIVEVWGSAGGSAMSLLGYFEGLDLTDYSAGEIAVGVTEESSSSLTWTVLTDAIEVTDRGKSYYETHDSLGNLVNQVHGHYLPLQKKSQKLLLQDYRQVVLPGWQYTLAGKVRWDGVAGGAIPLYSTLHSASGQEYALLDVATSISGTGAYVGLIDTGISGTDGWQEFTCTFTVPVNPACYELRMRSKDISAGEFLIQRLVVSEGSAPLRTPYFATSGSYIATMDIGASPIPAYAFWRKVRTFLGMATGPAFTDELALDPSTSDSWTADISYQSADTIAGPYSGWVSDPSLVPDKYIVQARLIAASSGLSTLRVESGTPSVEYALENNDIVVRTFLKGNRAELPGGAVFANLQRPGQLKDIVTQRLPGERYSHTAVSPRTGRQGEFELQVFTAEAVEYIRDNWADTTFAIEAFGKWYEIRLSGAPDFQSQMAERRVGEYTFGHYVSKMPAAQIIQGGVLV